MAKQSINVKSLLTVLGKKVRNLFEEQIYKDALNKANGAKIEYETEKLKYVIEHVYIPDVPVTLPDGSKFYIEVKGNGRAWTPEVRRKMLQVREQHPGIDIRFVFYSDGKFGAKRKDGSMQTQSEWAEKNGFEYSIGRVPEEWFSSS